MEGNRNAACPKISVYRACLATDSTQANPIDTSATCQVRFCKGLLRLSSKDIYFRVIRTIHSFMFFDRVYNSAPRIPVLEVTL